MFLKPTLLILYLQVCYVCSRHMKDQEEHFPHRTRHLRQINQHGYRHESTSNNIQRETLKLLKQVEASINKQTYYQPYYYPDQAQEGSNLQSSILSILEDISSDLKHKSSTPQPQIIYVPYAQPPTKCECNCIYGTRDMNVSTENRFKIENEKKWGKSDPLEADDGLDDAFRPVSFDIVPPNRPLSNPAPPVQHGSIQASMDSQTEDPTNTSCYTVIMSCCGSKEAIRDDCFNYFGCSSEYNSNTCTRSNINKILDWYQKKYLFS